MLNEDKEIEENYIDIQNKKTGRKTKLLYLCGLIIIVTAFIVVSLLRTLNKNKKAAEDMENSMEDIALLSAPAVTVEAEEIDLKEGAEETNASAVVEEENPEPLSESNMKIKDIYAECGEEVLFQAYYNDAVSYTWKTYDMNQKDWIEAPNENVLETMDELYRQISMLSIMAADDMDNMMVQCNVTHSDGTETEDNAFLHIIKDVESIEVDDVEAEAGGYINSMDIPVNITYNDGTSSSVAGLSGLHFVETEDYSEISENEKGNKVETITTTITELDYVYLGLEEKNVKLRYRAIPIVEVKLKGIDDKKPVIEDVKLSDFEISSEDKPVKINVCIDAHDEMTPYPMLKYAFVPEGADITESDWKSNNSFDIEINQNGIWTAYCADESGNLESVSREIIAVDQIAPALSLAISKEEDWCTENKITATASDTTKIQYLFTCSELGIDTGWVSDNELEVKQNGKYTVQAKDAAGNISTQEITVSNIDSSGPVILNITEGDCDYEN